MPVGQVDNSSGDTSIRIAGSGLSTAAQHDATEIVIGRGPATVVHDQDLRLREFRVDGLVRWNQRWGVWLAGGTRVIDTQIVYRDGDGAPVLIVNPSLHHRTERITGLIDVELGGERSLQFGKVTLRLRAGLTLPTGTTVQDPFALGDAGLVHQHIQTGTGTVDSIVSLSANTRVLGFDASLTAWTRQIWYENSKGYQGGDRYLASVAVGRKLWGPLTLRAHLDGYRESAERWNGVVRTDDGNVGRTDVLAGGTALVQLAPQLALEASVRVPAYVDIKGGQLSYPAIGSIAIVFSPRAKSVKPRNAANEHGDDEHGHDHDEHGHDEHGHDEHGGDEHGHDEHGHDEHGHDEHGHDGNNATEPGKDGHDHPPSNLDGKQQPTPPPTDTGTNPPKPPPAEPPTEKPTGKPTGMPTGKPTGKPKTAAKVRTLRTDRYSLELSTEQFTIVDFAADWCVPCKALTPKLIQFAGKNSEVTLRIADVTSPDSALARGHFGDKQYQLPRVELYNKKRQLLAVMTGTADEILSSLRSTLAKHGAAN